MSDIIEVQGVPCVSFAVDETSRDGEDDEDGDRPHAKRAHSPEEARRLKNEASRRIVPIHPRLLEMGFMDWVEVRRRCVAPNDLLFAGLRWEEKSGYGRQPGEHLLKLLKAAGVWRRRRKVGHSLRSNCYQELKNAGLPLELTERVVGHSTKAMGDKRYNETDAGPALPVHQVLEAMRKTDFGVKFPTWQEVSALQLERARATASRRTRA